MIGTLFQYTFVAYLLGVTTVAAVAAVNKATTVDNPAAQGAPSGTNTLGLNRPLRILNRFCQ